MGSHEQHATHLCKRKGIKDPRTLNPKVGRTWSLVRRFTAWQLRTTVRSWRLTWDGVHKLDPGRLSKLMTHQRRHEHTGSNSLGSSGGRHAVGLRVMAGGTTTSSSQAFGTS